MGDYELDDIDRGILHLLQEDARGMTTGEMGERVDVSASTVGNRIERMEAAGVIRGFHPEIDYDAAGFDLHVLFICQAPPADRTRVAERTLGISGVVEVSELVDGDENVLVEAVASDADDMARMHDELAASGVDVRRTAVFRDRYVQPFDHFRGAVSDDAPEP